MIYEQKIEQKYDSQLMEYYNSGELAKDLVANKFEAAAKVLMGISAEYQLLSTTFSDLYTTIDEWKNALYGELAAAKPSYHQQLYEFIDDFSFSEMSIKQKQEKIDAKMMSIGLDSKNFFTNQDSVEGKISELVLELTAIDQARETLVATITAAQRFLANYVPQTQALQIHKLACVKESLADVLAGDGLFLSMQPQERKDLWNKLVLLAKDRQLGKVDLSNQQMTEYNFASCDFGKRSSFQKATVRNANFAYAQLRHANFSESVIASADFTQSNIALADIDLANAVMTNFTGADISESNLSQSDFTKANFTGAELSFANAADSNFTNADFTDANLSEVDFTNANLFGAVFNGANLKGTKLTDAKNVDPQAVHKAVNWQEAYFE